MTGTDFVSARAASESDLDCVVELAQMAVAELRSDRGGELLLFHDLDDVGQRRRYADALASGESLLAVGLIDDVCVGYAHALVARAGRPTTCMIEELYVHVEARSVGVGAALLAEARAWGRANGCRAIESQVLPGNRDAKNFFERVGMVTRKMQVSVELD